MLPMLALFLVACPKRNAPITLQDNICTPDVVIDALIEKEDCSEVISWADPDLPIAFFTCTDIDPRYMSIAMPASIWAEYHEAFYATYDIDGIVCIDNSAAVVDIILEEGYFLK